MEHLSEHHDAYFRISTPTFACKSTHTQAQMLKVILFYILYFRSSSVFQLDFQIILCQTGKDI